MELGLDTAGTGEQLRDAGERIVAQLRSRHRHWDVTLHVEKLTEENRGVKRRARLLGIDDNKTNILWHLQKHTREYRC